MKKQPTDMSDVYKGDSIRLMIKDSIPTGQKGPFGAKFRTPDMP